MLASIVSAREQLAALVLAGRIADLGGAAAHQHDRLVPGLLEPAQHHDLDEAADMERRRGRVEADIAGHDLRAARARRAPRRRSPGGYSRARRAGGGGRICIRSWRRRLARARHARASGIPLRTERTGLPLSRAMTPERMPSPALVRHPDTPRGRRERRGRARPRRDRSARLRYASRRRWPRWSAAAAGAGARRRAVADDLLRALPARRASEAYREFNFSPSGDWAAYRFDGYRDGHGAELAPMPRTSRCMRAAAGARSMASTLQRRPARRISPPRPLRDSASPP